MHSCIARAMDLRHIPVANSLAFGAIFLPDIQYLYFQIHDLQGQSCLNQRLFVLPILGIGSIQHRIDTIAANRIVSFMQEMHAKRPCCRCGCREHVQPQLFEIEFQPLEFA